MSVSEYLPSRRRFPIFLKRVLKRHQMCGPSWSSTKAFVTSNHQAPVFNMRISSEKFVTTNINVFVLHICSKNVFHVSFISTLSKFKHKLKFVRIVRRCGIEDDMGADEMMFQALSKVESSLGKPLTKEDANGCSMWKKEIDKINAKLVAFQFYCSSLG